ncbi:MAG: vitamin K epoxide reductase family protein [Bacteroidota bacterium]
MSMILERFLIQNNYTHIHRKDITLQLQTHPLNPSIRAITDTLDYFGIENVAANVPEDSLLSLPDSFITYIDQEQPEMVLLVKNKSSVYCYTEDNRKKKYSFSDFTDIWIPQIIAIEEGAKDSTVNLVFMVLGGFLVTGVLGGFLWLNEASRIEVVMFLLSAIGFYISQLLVQEKIGIQSPWVHAICTSSGKSNCNEVINSKGSAITESISLADASVMYFSILTFQIIFFGCSGLVSLFILSSIPVVLFSMYYQALVIKKWCPLCLGIAVLLIFLNVLNIPSWEFSFTPLQITEFLISMIVLIPTYLYGKNLIVSRKKVEDKLFAANRFKRHPDVLANLMNNAKVVHDLSKLENEIRIGNPEAAHKVIAFTNPFCGFCKSAFESYVKIIKSHPEIEIWIRFNVEYENVESTATKISARLAELHFKEGQELFINAFVHWFEHKNDHDWLKKYGNPDVDKSSIRLFESHRNWAVHNSISYTPATIIAGKVFPGFYGYDDLSIVIEDILETTE